MMRVGYLTAQQFAEIIAPSIIDVTSTTYQPLDGTLTALAGLGWTAGSQVPTFTAADTVAFRSVGAAAGTDILDRAAGDGRYALAAHTHAIADVTGLQAALDAKLDDTQASAFGLTLLDDADAATARTTLGLGTIATQAAASVAITGGSITGITDLAVADGGTGASTAAAARTNLGLGTAATQNTGTSGANIPLLSTANTFGAAQTISSTNVPMTINSTNSNTYKFNFQRAGAVDAYVGSNATYIFTIADSGVVDRVSFGVSASPGMFFSGTKVIGTRITGWAAASGTATRTTFDTATVTTAQLAERVKALIDDLRTHGMIGT